MYDPKQKLNIFSRKKDFFFLNTTDFSGGKDIRKEKQIRELGLGI